MRVDGNFNKKHVDFIKEGKKKTREKRKLAGTVVVSRWWEAGHVTDAISLRSGVPPGKANSRPHNSMGSTLGAV